MMLPSGKKLGFWDEGYRGIAGYYWEKGFEALAWNVWEDC